MEHPLQDNLTKLGLDELDKRYSELTKRYTIARRMNMPPNVLSQLELMLESIDMEKIRRYDKIDPNEDPVVLDTDK